MPIDTVPEFFGVIVTAVLFITGPSYALRLTSRIFVPYPLDDIAAITYPISPISNEVLDDTPIIVDLEEPAPPPPPPPYEAYVLPSYPLMPPAYTVESIPAAA
ncbi:hypothetical protein CONPUDRAFT_154019 [Coniophora puteana RWD-64-598 SS2]|uniref:Uncharacterized protein n=1 Tax=Coniophora puteana (strain RWD-64-598) TaxID=741705 RepID=A0A5M3MQJ8_CONPW|nr:uncharacterized protein CONPUDRAFT_154019 [Coniophora puteana RWD-64-598 SS2]EIW81478.1 hypothetical protein CONPUDRAFT_154019 [Coniophora puteana RWD-64-598 SS2]